MRPCASWRACCGPLRRWRVFWRPRGRSRSSGLGRSSTSASLRARPRGKTRGRVFALHDSLTVSWRASDETQGNVHGFPTTRFATQRRLTRIAGAFLHHGERSPGSRAGAPRYQRAVAFCVAGPAVPATKPASRMMQSTGRMTQSVDLVTQFAGLVTQTLGPVSQFTDPVMGPAGRMMQSSDLVVD
jgi:hypothetical protein